MRLTAGVEVNSQEQIIVAVVYCFGSVQRGFRPQGATHSSGGSVVGRGFRPQDLSIMGKATMHKEMTHLHACLVPPGEATREARGAQQLHAHHLLPM